MVAILDFDIFDICQNKKQKMPVQLRDISQNLSKSRRFKVSSKVSGGFVGFWTIVELNINELLRCDINMNSIELSSGN